MLSILIAAVGVTALVGACDGRSASSATAPPPPVFAVGVNLEGAGGRGLEFVDAMRTSHSFESFDGSPLAVDERGWPKTDAKVLVFDLRPVKAWDPPADDPDLVMINVAGVYTLRFTGRADVRATHDGGACEVRSPRHDAATDTTTAEVVLPPGHPFLQLHFRNTRGGVRNVSLLRPGYAAETREVFHKPFLAAIEPFTVLRYMDWLQTNADCVPFTDPKNTLEWADRRMPDDASQTDARPGKRAHGVAWEHIAALANQTRKDLWINVPVHASDDYAAELARLLKRSLDPQRIVYLEYGNEVWNAMFPASAYNRATAEAELAAGAARLAYDGQRNRDIIACRRYAKRLIEISRIFAKEFDQEKPASQTGRVRPVFCWQIANTHPWEPTLSWVQATYGPVSEQFYAIAGAPYYNADKAGKTASVDGVLDALAAASDATVGWRKHVLSLAGKHGVRAYCYEAGPDTGGGDPANIANRIRANRHERMGQIVERDVTANWRDLGGSLYMHFTLTSPYSRYGCWGLTEDLERLDTPKMLAIRRAMEPKPAASN